ncbi:hypothetical protein LFM09_42655 [Lentzea alba]|uniref:DUF6636 domain-containing protein n=1 Tax=Lentzea alba TaxID=2714351 RepID=UPI0039BFB9E6
MLRFLTHSDDNDTIGATTTSSPVSVIPLPPVTNQHTGRTSAAPTEIAVDPADYRFDHAEELYYFRSPSGKFFCGIVTAPMSAGCHGPTSPVPPRPESCAPQISWGAGMSVDRDGTTGFICTGGVIYANGFGETDPVLPYGHSLTVLGFSCTSAPAGIRCTHLTTGHGFRIATDSNEQF